MSKLKIFLYLSLVAMTGSVVAAQSTVDEDFMQIMEDRQKSLSSNISLKNATAAREDVKELEDMFNEVEAFYVHKGNATDAVNWSKESKELAAAIEKYVASNDFDTASQTSATLAKTCKTCHRVYKKDA
jgi:predicted DNA-binding protein